MKEIINVLKSEFSVGPGIIENIIEMLDEGNTVPFIARYRKERTGGMSDEILRDLYERLQYLKSLQERRDAVLKSIDEQDKLTDELRKKIAGAKTLTEIEDIYRPFKQKKRTRAMIAAEKGLKPLAEAIMSGKFHDDIEKFAEEFINIDSQEDVKLQVKTSAEALAGAEDIISEVISDEAEYRKWIRDLLRKEGIIETSMSAKANDEKEIYKMYYEYSEKVKSVAPHRMLAINRGEKEKILSVKVAGNTDKIIEYIKIRTLKGNKITDKYLDNAVKDSFKRLIFPSVEREIRNELTEKAENSAIDVFKKNLKPLLMQPPTKNKVVLGYDPGFRTGCKIAVLDETGKVLATDTLYATMPKDNKENAKKKLRDICIKNNVDIISLGNGTACRESEELISQMIIENNMKDLCYVIVSEAGASVYSASKLATQEYPDIDVSIRGAISIARRLMDPMAELVKIDPKSLGVGQYQHDVTQKKLNESLSGVVESSVNNVGVDLNIATPALLAYISGVNATIAKNIVEYREENGKFKTRKELKKVKRLGDKAFEQCAGFLRVTESKEPLDNTSVHPESYNSAKTMLDLLGYKKEAISKNQLNGLEEKIQAYGTAKLAEECGVGELTLVDIAKELVKPGRDPREEMPKPIFKTGIIEMEHLTDGMILQGTVRNVADFGAFIDIGVHVDGLVHISQLADRFIKHPSDVVKVGDVVTVKITEIDHKRKRISLTMKNI